MIVERYPRLALTLGTAGALVLVVLHARAGEPRREAAPTVVTASQAAAPVAPTAPAAPAGAAPAVPAATAPTGATEGAIPQVTLPCVDERTELLTRGDQPVLCWGDRCLSDPGDPGATVARPAPATDLPLAVSAMVQGDRVCAGTRCAPIGRRLRAEIAGGVLWGVTATRDLAAIVLFDGSIGFEAWNRAADQPIDLGEATEDEGEIVRVEAIGDRVLVARSCNEYCSAIARIIDARGHHHGDAFYSDAVLGGERASIAALDTDHVVVLGRWGEVALIERGQLAASASLLPDSAPRPAAIEGLVRISDTSFAVMWCPESDANPTCHLSQLSIHPGERGVKAGIDPVEDRLLPRCAHR